MKRRVWMIALAAAVFAAPQAGAYSFLNTSYGTVELGLSPRVRAMGGAGSSLAQGAYGLVDNPATLALAMENRVHVDGYLARSSENRFVPIYDTFDAFVTENAVGVNDNEYAALQGGFVWDPFKDLDIVLSAGMFNRYDTRYDYFNEIRANGFSDDLDSTHTVSSSGVIRSVTAGAAWAIPGGHGVGLSLNYYYGTIESREVFTDRVSPTRSSSRVLERKMDGVSVTLGGTARVNERIRLSGAFETKPTLTSDNTAWFNGEPVTVDDLESTDLKLPMRLQGGFTYQPRNTLKTTFAADLVYMPWSETTDDLRDEDSTELKDTWEARFGLEHVFYNDLGGRLGFRYGNSYAMDNAEMATFTFGFGYALKQLTMDIGAEVSKRESRQEPIFDRPNQPTAPSTSRDRVEDTLIRVFLGVDYRF